MIKWIKEPFNPPVDRTEIRRAMDKANRRFINPRVSLKKKMDEKAVIEKIVELFKQKTMEYSEKLKNGEEIPF